MSSLMFKLTGTHLIPVQDQTSYLAVPEAWGNFSVLCQTSAGICLTDLIWEGISFPLYHSYGIQKNLIHLASQLGKQVNTNHAMCRASLKMSQNVKQMCFSKLQIKTVMAWLRFQPAEIWWHQWWLLWRQTPLSRCQTNPTLWFARKEWQDPEKCKYPSRIPSKPFSAIKSKYLVLKESPEQQTGATLVVTRDRWAHSSWCPFSAATSGCPSTWWTVVHLIRVNKTIQQDEFQEWIARVNCKSVLQ